MTWKALLACKVLEQRKPTAALNSLSRSSGKEAQIMVVKVVVGQKRLHKVWYVELNSLKFTQHDREIPIIIIRPSQPLSSLCKQKKSWICWIFCVLSMAGWIFGGWIAAFSSLLLQTFHVERRMSGQHWKKAKLGWSAFCLKRREQSGIKSGMWRKQNAARKAHKNEISITGGSYPRHDGRQQEERIHVKGIAEDAFAIRLQGSSGRGINPGE